MPSGVVRGLYKYIEIGERGDELVGYLKGSPAAF